MKTWKIPVAWTRAGVVTVEANTLAEAAKIAGSDDRFSVPDESKHLLGVWDVTIEDVDFIRKWFNNDQQDE